MIMHLAMSLTYKNSQELLRPLYMLIVQRPLTKLVAFVPSGRIVFHTISPLRVICFLLSYCKHGQYRVCLSLCPLDP